MNSTQAWVLPAKGEMLPSTQEAFPSLQLERYDLGVLRENEALVEPLFGSWEANIDHALRRSPIDVCWSRGEKRVVLGNLGVVRVLRPDEGGSVHEGDVCLVMPFGRSDAHGYAELVFGYDMPGTVGLLAHRTKIDHRLLLPLPADSKHSLEQWASYARFFTAWDNWRCALACWRAQLPDADPSEHLVFAWGGGVAFAELLLAQREGFRVAMAVGSETRAAFIRRFGIEPILRIALSAAESAGVERNSTDLQIVLSRINELSGGQGAAVVIDNIGDNLHPVSLKALGREGVLTTCGWKAGMRTSHLRGPECISRHIHVHTHVWRSHDSRIIRDFQESADWIAPRGSHIVYKFEDVPVLAQCYAAGQMSSYFPLYAINAL